MILSVRANRVEFIYDKLDTNAVNFIHDAGYFSVQTSIYLEEDEELNNPYFELNDQGQSQSGGLERLVLFNNSLGFVFQGPRLFLKRYETIEILTKVDRQLVEFCSNWLYLGKYMSYDKQFDKANMVLQTKKREYL